MSNTTEKNADGSFKEKEKKVVATPEDAKAAFEFWKQFDITPMPGLKEAFDSFISSPTFENQEAMKLMLCRALSETEHECFKDETFAKVVAECADVAYAMQFDKDLEKTIGEEV